MMMYNVSAAGEDIVLHPNKYYYVIDALYCDDIRNAMGTLDMLNLQQEIRNKVFPYTSTPYARFLSQRDIFSVGNIKQAEPKAERGDPMLYFSSDTGLILFVAEDVFIDLIANADYNKLVDVVAGPAGADYWNSVRHQYTDGDVALMLSPGVGSGYEFTGGGSYKIDL